MEPQEDMFVYEKKEDKCNNKKCLALVAVILLVSFAVVIGLIIGAATSASVLAALTGRTNTPDMYEIMQVLGKDRVIKRFENEIKKLSK